MTEFSFLVLAFFVLILAWVFVSLQPKSYRCSVCNKKIAYPENFYVEFAKSSKLVLCLTHGGELCRLRSDPRQWPVHMGWK